MSDYCAGCAYDPAVKTGPGACPFNILYWNFLVENRAALAKNPRMAMPYRTLDRMAPERRKAIVREAAAFLAGLAGDSGPQGGGRAQLALDLDAPPPRAAARP
jgi:deoxyribodipyrimidine photolyase-related protein